jgi:uncharacterized membrane protein YbjE (DUF340 family)
MTTLLLALAAGLVAGVVWPAAGRALGARMTWAVLAVIAIQGGVLGSSDEVARAWGQTVGYGLLLAASMSVCVTLAVEAVARMLASRSAPGPSRPVAGGPRPSVDVRGPVLILGMLLLGAVIGRLWTEGPWGTLSTQSLVALLFVVGADLGQQRRAIVQQMRAAADLVWIVPVALFASFVGGALASVAMPFGVAGIASGALGSGWYSLAGPMMTELGGPVLGAVVLLGNLFRETIAMIVIPWLAARGWSRQAASALGGATAMDTTLPFVVCGWGPRGAVTALGVGVGLSMTGPPLIAVAWNVFAGG